MVVAFVAMTIVFDGLDNQAIGFAIPSLSQAWGIPPESFRSVAAFGLIGMTVGTAIAGFIGDMLGRRGALIGSVLMFGLLTMATALAMDLTTLTVLRFLAGIGLGGAMPNAAAMAAEFSPLRNRPMSVTLTIVCVPLGGLLGGLLAANILPEYGWKALFLVAGAAPVLLALVLMVKLPESPRYLARDPRQNDKLQALLKTMGHAIPAGAAIVDPQEADTPKVSLGALFSSALWSDTVVLWAAFFLCLIAVYTVFSWVPATLTQAGYDQRMASLGLAGFNLGGVIGAVGAAWVMGKVGSRRTMLSLCVLGIAAGTAIAVIGIAALGNLAVIAMLALLGIAINGVQTTMFALAVHIYPSTIRASGVGSALAFGRVGAILSAYRGAAILASGGGGRFFALLAAAMAGTFVALALINRHVPATQGQTA
jgi:AAHS family 4-hydroxybenzoate transporter-like MFS transporter